ncbi:hypothetical protein RISK_000923 [Rhodopirellula islandica]|uniref:Pilus formation protein N-terminal domain-containing protein n=1 Tax=Rhodopirellula islandica TaxID=595434 RepID=A0A0J1BKU2_RHOIS|nr:hypothetical protein [Rhodopirellula islandica]KLU07122.1 hypothetical protein RISK_000923 [Rhodopirellula islandica]
MLIGKTMNPMGSNQMVSRRKRERLARWLTQAVVWGGCIAASQVAGSTALADETATDKLPPIRLVSGSMHSNPFVKRSASHQAVGPILATKVNGHAAASNVNLLQNHGSVAPEGQTTLYPIRQTSDQTMSEIKLKSIGTAVGLLPIGAPVSEKTPLVVEPPRAPQTRINPHAQPDYDRVESGGIVEWKHAQLSPAVEPTKSLETPPELQWTQPRIARQTMPLVKPEIVAEEVVAETPVVEATVPTPSSEPVKVTAVVAEEADVAIAEESEPIEFSLNDAMDSMNAESVSLSFSDASLSGSEASENKGEESIAMPEPLSIAAPVQESAAPASLPLLPQPVQVHLPSEMVVQQHRHLPVKIDAPAHFEHVASERMHEAPVRHRAAVAVEAPPMVAVAQPSQDAPAEGRVSATLIVPAALAGHRGPSRQNSSNGSGSTLLVQDAIVCDPDDVTSLTVDGIIEAVRVEDDSVARVISSTSRHLRLIGVRPGKTRVLVQQKVAGQEGSLREIYELHVAASSNVRGGESQQERSLMELIEQKFRTASVQVTRQGDRIVVQGECDDSQDAKEIVRLIRKTFLVPVEDQLILR